MYIIKSGSSYNVLYTKKTKKLKMYNSSKVNSIHQAMFNVNISLMNEFITETLFHLIKTRWEFLMKA